MGGILEKIAWLTRRWNYSFSLLDLSFHDHYSSWGFRLFSFTSLRTYSLLRFHFRLPNMTDVRKFTVDEWDIFFLYNFLFKQYDDLSDRKMW